MNDMIFIVLNSPDGSNNSIVRSSIDVTECRQLIVTKIVTYVATKSFHLAPSNFPEIFFWSNFILVIIPNWMNAVNVDIIVTSLLRKISAADNYLLYSSSKRVRYVFWSKRKKVCVKMKFFQKDTRSRNLTKQETYSIVDSQKWRRCSAMSIHCQYRRRFRYHYDSTSDVSFLVPRLSYCIPFNRCNQCSKVKTSKRANFKGGISIRPECQT